MVVPFIGSLVSFVIALLVGGLAIYFSASLVTGKEDYSHALFTALFGAIAWAFTSWIPLIGPIIALVAWIWVINWRYKGGWANAAIIGLIAWLAASIILFILNAILNLGIGAFGIPGA